MNLNHLGFTRFTCLTTSWKLTHSEDNDRMKEILTVFRIAEREIKADTKQDNGYPRETVPPQKPLRTATHSRVGQRLPFEQTAGDPGYVHLSCKLILFKIMMDGWCRKTGL